MKNLCGAISMFTLTVLALTAPASAENWPQWRGPFFNGSTTERDLPTTFSRTENVLWTMPGPSGSTPIVWGDRVFVSSPDAKTQKLLAISLDARTGKVLWQKETGEDRRCNQQNNMASPSPITDGKTAWFYYGTGQIFAFDMDGNALWSRDLTKSHGPNPLMFGYSSSPLLFDGRLYIQVIRNKKLNRYGQGPEGAGESYLLALDPATGKDLWKVERPTDARDEGQEAYSSPIPFTEGGRREVLVCGGDYLTGHDPATGKELWRWAGYNPTHINHWRIIPSPLVADGLVFVAGPKHSKLFAVQPEGSGDLAEKNVAWTFDRQFPDAASLLAYQGRLFALDDDGKVMTSLVPKTGEKKWQLPLGGDHVFRASPLGADGKVYCMNEVGEVFVLAAGDEPKLLHRTVLGSGPVCRSTIVAAGGRLYVRTTDTLYAFGQSAAK